ncbi:MAG: NAD(P)H-dependent oxidoreductase [Thiotrichaceae bacterium]
MKITVINGSQRHAKNSQSLKVAKYISNALIEEQFCQQTHLISMTDKPYPLWDESIWDGDQHWKDLLEPVAGELESSDGFVVIVPEYHGMAPAALKNFLLMHNKNQIGHKPALLVGVSSSDGGAYSIAEMRMNSSKNNRLCYIPEQLIVRNVESVLNPDEADNNADADSYFKERISFALGVLSQYAVALKQVRESGVTDNAKFSNGM